MNFLQYTLVRKSGTRQNIILHVPQISEMYDCGEITLVIMTNNAEHLLNIKLPCLLNEIAQNRKITTLNKETNQ